MNKEETSSDAVDFLKWLLATNFLVGDSDGHECVLIVDSETEESLYERYLDSKNR